MTVEMQNNYLQTKQSSQEKERETDTQIKPDVRAW